jgi:alkanesulfonate monooxygenase SsuD/methylene tetrahydromethanopterin reductase-like flavin-dependent oxidoreductase (luciferase family)
MRTRRVRIGLAAAILPFHDPVRLAEELAIVDILSDGRLDVGVGRGNRPVEFEGYRVPQVENRERFEECLAILLKAWTTERVAHEGRHFTIPEVRGWMNFGGLPQDRVRRSMELFAREVMPRFR